MRCRAVRIAAQVCAAALLATSAQAATLHVPSEYPTIQAAVDATVHGDLVLVAPGTYSGSGNQDIDFHGKNITLRSEAGPDVTVIEPTGPAPRRAVILQTGETSAAIDGFAIQDGYASFGGAILCLGASVTIFNCRFTENFASYGPGGAIYCESGSLNVIDCVLARNYSIDFALGGAIFADASTIVVRGCTITDSEASFGGQIDLYGSSVATVENTIIAFGHQGSIDGQPGSTVTLRCSNLFGNGSDWGGWLAPQANQNGNISLDPLFCDAEGLDFELYPESPCLPENSMGCGLIGALGIGCGTTSAPEPPMRSWGQIKGLYK